MSGRATLIGVIAAVALFGLMIWDGWFMHGDSDVECLPYADCEVAE